MEATLRIREGEDEAAVREHLREALVSLFETFGPGLFEVTLTANVVLKGNYDGADSYSIFYGQDYADRDLNAAPKVEVRDLAQAALLPTSFSAAQFDSIFGATFENTTVSVDSVIAQVYIFRRSLDNFERQRFSYGNTLQRLY